MSVPQVIADNAEQARKGVDKYVEIFGKNTKKAYKRLGYTMESTKQQFVKKFQEGGYGLMSVVTETDSIPTSGYSTDNETDFYWVKRGYGDERSYESYSTDIYGLTKKIARKLAKGAEDTRQSLSSNQFNNHTSTGAPYIGMDGVALVSTTHPFDGGTWSNRGVTSSNTDADLSAVTLEQAIQKNMDVVNDKGNPDSVEGPFKLYVPTALMGLANRLTKKLSPQLPGSANNDGNWAGGLITEVIADPWLTDEDAWFLISASSDENGLFMLTHEGRLLETDIDKRRQMIAQLMTEKLSFFAEDARGIWGSPGA